MGNSFKSSSFKSSASEDLANILTTVARKSNIFNWLHFNSTCERYKVFTRYFNKYNCIVWLNDNDNKWELIYHGYTFDLTNYISDIIGHKLTKLMENLHCVDLYNNKGKFPYTTANDLMNYIKTQQVV